MCQAGAWQAATVSAQALLCGCWGLSCQQAGVLRWPMLHTGCSLHVWAHAWPVRCLVHRAPGLLPHAAATVGSRVMPCCCCCMPQDWVLTTAAAVAARAAGLHCCLGLAAAAVEQQRHLACVTDWVLLRHICCSCRPGTADALLGCWTYCCCLCWLTPRFESTSKMTL